MLALANHVLHQATDAVELMRLILRRHAQVQSGKFDKGLPKAAWTRLADGGDRVRRTAPRHQLAASHAQEGWKDVGRHPYRTGSPFPFIQECNINGRGWENAKIPQNDRPASYRFHPANGRGRPSRLVDLLYLRA